jgi:antirestriction protein ArdC
MSSKTASACPGHDRASLYNEITGKIIVELEAGRVPWVQPWGTAAAKAPLAMPKNAATGRQYSGINVLILWGAVIEHGFPARSWLTFRQALSLGGNVRKGEHGTTVVYADRFVPDDEKRRARETGEEAAAIPFLKRFTVFNAAQCENLPAEVAAVAPPPLPGLIEPRVETLIRATGIDFRIGGNRAFYAPGPDFVMVPPPQAYFEPVNWHRTALHELGHASGQAGARSIGCTAGARWHAIPQARRRRRWSDREAAPVAPRRLSGRAVFGRQRHAQQGCHFFWMSMIASARARRWVRRSLVLCN